MAKRPEISIGPNARNRAGENFTLPQNIHVLNRWWQRHSKMTQMQYIVSQWPQHGVSSARGLELIALEWSNRSRTFNWQHNSWQSSWINHQGTDWCFRTIRNSDSLTENDTGPQKLTFPLLVHRASGRVPPIYFLAMAKNSYRSTNPISSCHLTFLLANYDTCMLVHVIIFSSLRNWPQGRWIVPHTWWLCSQTTK